MDRPNRAIRQTGIEIGNPTEGRPVYTCLKYRRVRGSTPGALKKLEVRAGIEPAYADLQSDASPLCHRTSVVARRISCAARPGVKSGPAVRRTKSAVPVLAGYPGSHPAWRSPNAACISPAALTE